MAAKSVPSPRSSRSGTTSPRKTPVAGLDSSSPRKSPRKETKTPVSGLDEPVEDVTFRIAGQDFTLPQNYWEISSSLAEFIVKAVADRKNPEDPSYPSGRLIIELSLNKDRIGEKIVTFENIYQYIKHHKGVETGRSVDVKAEFDANVALKRAELDIASAEKTIDEAKEIIDSKDSSEEEIKKAKAEIKKADGLRADAVLVINAKDIRAKLINHPIWTTKTEKLVADPWDNDFCVRLWKIVYDTKDKHRIRELQNVLLAANYLGIPILTNIIASFIGAKLKGFTKDEWKIILDGGELPEITDADIKAATDKAVKKITSEAKEDSPSRKGKGGSSGSDTDTDDDAPAKKKPAAKKKAVKKEETSSESDSDVPVKKKTKASPKKSATSSKKSVAAKKKADTDTESEDDVPVKKPSPKKAATSTAKKAATSTKKKAKKEETDTDTDDTPPSRTAAKKKPSPKKPASSSAKKTPKKKAASSGSDTESD